MPALLVFLKPLGEWFLAFVLKRVVQALTDYFREQAKKKEEAAKAKEKAEEFKKKYAEAVKSGDEEKQKDAYKDLFNK
jgi:uncharacterized membrane protein (DUF106 family)